MLTILSALYATAKFVLLLVGLVVAVVAVMVFVAGAKKRRERRMRAALGLPPKDENLSELVLLGLFLLILTPFRRSW